MAIDSGDLVGGGGAFRPTFISPVLIATVGAGIRATITPPSGKAVRLVFFASASSASTAFNMQIKVAGVVVKAAGDLFFITGGTHSGGTPNNWALAAGTGSASTNSTFAYVEGDIDENITIETTGGMTNAANYMFMEGVK